VRGSIKWELARYTLLVLLHYYHLPPRVPGQRHGIYASMSVQAPPTDRRIGPPHAHVCTLNWQRVFVLACALACALCVPCLHVCPVTIAGCLCVRCACTYAHASCCSSPSALCSSACIYRMRCTARSRRLQYLPTHFHSLPMRPRGAPTFNLVRADLVRAVGRVGLSFEIAVNVKRECGKSWHGARVSQPCRTLSLRSHVPTLVVLIPAGLH
jgi:hypothetical protein